MGGWVSEWVSGDEVGRYVQGFWIREGMVTMD